MYIVDKVRKTNLTIKLKHSSFFVPLYHIQWEQVSENIGGEKEKLSGSQEALCMKGLNHNYCITRRYLVNQWFIFGIDSIQDSPFGFEETWREGRRIFLLIMNVQRKTEVWKNRGSSKQMFKQIFLIVKFFVVTYLS